MADSVREYCFYRLGTWNFDAVCSWLADLSHKGIVLQSVKGHRFYFHSEETSELDYHIEYISANVNEMLQYTQLCGWRYICSDGYIHYFCCPKGAHYYTGAFYKRKYYRERESFYRSQLAAAGFSTVLTAICTLLIALRLTTLLAFILLGIVGLLFIYSVSELTVNAVMLSRIRRRIASLPAYSPPSKTAELIMPSKDYAQSFLDACDAYRASGGVLYDITSMPEALALIRRLQATHLPSDEENYTPYFTYWLVDKGEYIGSGNLRLSITGEMRMCGGNIAYEIRPEKRLKGYGTIILRELLLCAAEKGMSSVVLTCEADNVSGVNTIENCGGKLTDVRVVENCGVARPTRIYTVNLKNMKE